MHFPPPLLTAEDDEDIVKGVGIDGDAEATDLVDEGEDQAGEEAEEEGAGFQGISEGPHVMEGGEQEGAEEDAGTADGRGRLQSQILEQPDEKGVKPENQGFGRGNQKRIPDQPAGETRPGQRPRAHGELLQRGEKNGRGQKHRQREIRFASIEDQDAGHIQPPDKEQSEEDFLIDPGAHRKHDRVERSGRRLGHRQPAGGHQGRELHDPEDDAAQEETVERALEEQGDEEAERDISLFPRAVISDEKDSDQDQIEQEGGIEKIGAAEMLENPGEVLHGQLQGHPGRVDDRRPEKKQPGLVEREQRKDEEKTERQGTGTLVILLHTPVRPI